VIDEGGKLRAIDTSVKVDAHGKDLVELIEKLRG
jgi:peroxiredoxin